CGGLLCGQVAAEEVCSDERTKNGPPEMAAPNLNTNREARTKKRERHGSLRRTLSVHDFRSECLGLTQVHEILIGRLVRHELCEILEGIGRHRRRNAAEERAELLLALSLGLVKTEQTIDCINEAMDWHFRYDLAEVRDT